MYLQLKKHKRDKKKDKSYTCKLKERIIKNLNLQWNTYFALFQRVVFYQLSYFFVLGRV